MLPAGPSQGASPISFARMKQNFFATKQRGAEKTPGFLVQNHTRIAEEYRHLDAVLRTSFNASAHEAYQEFKAYCEEMLELYTKTIRYDFKKPLRDNLAFAHVSRTMLSSARFIVVQILQLLEEGEYLGDATYVNKMIHLLMVPTQCFYILSIAVPGVRLLTDLANVAKHAIYPTGTTSTEAHELSLTERFTSELYRARFSIINDTLSVIINTLSNFPEIFNISPIIATSLVFAGLIFDIFFLLYAYNIAYNAFMEKKNQYDHEIALDSPGMIQEMSQKQRLELELSYYGIQSNLNVSLLAGSVILLGFTLLMTAPVPIFAPLGGLLCMLGTSLYLAAETYAHYEQHIFILKHNTSSPRATTSDIHASEKATQKAWDNFMLPLITNTCFPVILMSTLVVSSPAALLLLIAFITFKLQSPGPEPLLTLIH